MGKGTAKTNEWTGKGSEMRVYATPDFFTFSLSFYPGTDLLLYLKIHG